jgi:hypothetical protein
MILLFSYRVNMDLDAGGFARSHEGCLGRVVLADIAVIVAASGSSPCHNP